MQPHVLTCFESDPASPNIGVYYTLSTNYIWISTDIALIYKAYKVFSYEAALAYKQQKGLGKKTQCIPLDKYLRGAGYTF